jgi:phospholipid/cholesterol/gamma-HCH transport system permease protein
MIRLLLDGYLSWNHAVVKGIIAFILTAFSFPKFSVASKLLLAHAANLGCQTVIITTLFGILIGVILRIYGVQFIDIYLLDFQHPLAVFVELSILSVAFLFIMLCGSKITAQIAKMQVTGSLDCMALLNAQPSRHILWPRIWAGIILLPVIIIIFFMITIFSISIDFINWSLDSYLWQQLIVMNKEIAIVELIVLKSFIFSIGIVCISMIQGLNVIQQPGYIHHAVIRTLLYASIYVVLLDALLILFMKT